MFTGYAFAQQDSDFELKLQKLENDILKLKRVADRYNRQKEQSLLIIAYKEYLAARKSYDTGRIQLAKFHYLKSQKIVIAVAQNLVFTPAAKLKSDLKLKIDNAERIVNKNPNNEEGRYLLSKARLYQMKMDESLHNSNFQNAYKFYNIANYFANRILQLFNDKNSSIAPAERYKKLAENIRKLYKEVNSGDLNDKNTANAISKVDKLIRQARVAHEKGAYRQAFINLQIAEKLLYRIIDLKNTGMNLSEKEIKTELFSLKRYIDSIDEKTRLSGNRSQISLLNKSRQFLLGAERDVSLGEFRRAKKKISLAQRMATKALQLQLSNNANDSDLIKRRLAEVTRLLRLQEKRMKNLNDPSIQFLNNEAKTFLEEAAKLSQSENSSAAFFNIQIALKFINRIEILLDKKEEYTVSEQKLLNEMNELERDLSNIHPEKQPEKVTVLKTLLIKARNNYNSGNYEITSELVRTIKNQMNLLSR